MSVVEGATLRAKELGKDNVNISRDPPAPVKRQLRQEAGFGCCICSYPIFQYHHFRDFLPEPHHNPKDTMVLCPNHHDKATDGALEESEQRHWKRNPYNITCGFADGQLTINTRSIDIELGSNLFIGDGFKFEVDNEPLLKIERDKEGRILVSLELYDSDDVRLASVVQNEWITGDPLPWDFESDYRWLKLRRKKRDIALFIDARAQPIQLNGDFWRKAQNFSIKREFLLFNGVTENFKSVNNVFDRCKLRVDTTKSNFSIAPDLTLSS